MMQKLLKESMKILKTTFKRTFPSFQTAFFSLIRSVTDISSPMAGFGVGKWEQQQDPFAMKKISFALPFCEMSVPHLDPNAHLNAEET